MKKPLYIIFLLFISCANQSTRNGKEVRLDDKNPIGAAVHSTAIFINGYELFYNCFNCTPSYTDSVSVFAKKDTAINALFNLVLGDFYFSELEVFRQENEVFLLAKTDHTYGHSQSYLYHIDTTSFKTSAIELLKSEIVIPDSLEFWKAFGLQIENNKLTSVASFRSELNREKYYLEQELSLQKTKNSTYKLNIITEQLIKDELE
jgi:hypothetical protein